MRTASLAFLGWVDDDWVGDAANLAQLVAVALAIPAAFWAYRQLKAGTASAESQAILALDQAFDRFETFRSALNKGTLHVTDDNLVTLRRYVAVFERLGLLLKKRVVSIQLADQLYGSRFAKLVTNRKFKDKVTEILEERGGKGWENVEYLWKALKKEAAGRRNIPDWPPKRSVRMTDSERAGVALSRLQTTH